MEYITLGKTNLFVSRIGFGALPIQRVTDMDEVAAILRTAYEGGINFYDTARLYTDSEEKLGLCFSEMRDDIIFASKTMAPDASSLRHDIETSLENLQTDYIDLYQLHNPPFLPVPGGEDGLYDALLAEKKAGKIRHIGITNHSRKIILEAIHSGLYETVQYPFSYLSDEEDERLVHLCAEKQIGFIAMKALAGGLITNTPAAFAWMQQFENAVPVWGIQKKDEIDHYLALNRYPPHLDKKIKAAIQKDREELCGSFCRGCGYCLPCPAGIPINNANRMSQLLRRSPKEQWLTAEWQEGMMRIEQCTHCGYCSLRCPYGLKPYETLPGQLAEYLTFLEK
ncbi:aldo/keto reductase [Brucepastera parasyntrophica]|uniref:aldo/keto reductase n=1 Tax=Brucepastera parasyntrophica TaxID=2880008 RepID=UPI0021087F5A|nr:aldo/keto reductase [Brucepastera parasyntrophica]ULQ59454.1 aldo/keto reductase [Brucepastera parasyntrophica]